MTPFAQRLRTARTARGLSCAQVAECAGMQDISKYRQYEYGTQQPRIATLARLCRALGVSADWLLGLDEQEAQS